MDRNEAFRKRLDIKLNKGSFDPTPYVDIIMERIDYEDVEDIQEFMDDVLTDPSFDFIFGKSSLMNTTQKAKTGEQVLQRVVAIQGFDPEPHAQALMDIYETPEFDQYREFDEDDDELFNFHPYFDKDNLTKEQGDLIFETFIDLQSDKSSGYDILDSGLSKKQRSISYLFILGLIIIPPFFIPNLLQRLGWLPSDTGWLLKIGVGIISLIVLFFIIVKVIQVVANRAIKKIQRQGA